MDPFDRRLMTEYYFVVVQMTKINATRTVRASDRALTDINERFGLVCSGSSTVSIGYLGSYILTSI